MESADKPLAEIPELSAVFDTKALDALFDPVRGV